ncbi:MAG: hypothetical protein WCB49_04375, partial [Gammaproteobacteria bacterium]
SQWALAYDPLANVWFSGDPADSGVFAFNSQGKYLGFAGLGVQVIGLAFNPTTDHLFVLSGGDEDSIYVYNMANGFSTAPTVINIPHFNTANAGAGLGYDCEGHLWVDNYVYQQVIEINSGEKGWCSYEHIPWLSLSPSTGSVATGAAAQIALNIDGTGQKPYTTSQAQLRIVGTTPYPEQTIPVTVDWEPQPVALFTEAHAEPTAVAKGKYMTFDVAVTNDAAHNTGNASGVDLSFVLPANLEFVPQHNGACSPNGGMVVCNLGDIARGAVKGVTIITKATKPGTHKIDFSASAREPQLSEFSSSAAAEVKAEVTGPGQSGGGALGLLSLALLLGLALGMRRRYV